MNKEPVNPVNPVNNVKKNHTIMSPSLKFWILRNDLFIHSQNPKLLFKKTNSTKVDEKIMLLFTL